MTMNDDQDMDGIEHRFEVGDRLMTDIITTVSEELAQAEAERAEKIHRHAILGTDWRETAVLRIVSRIPTVHTFDPNEPYKIETPAYEVERYTDRAPPLSEYVDRDHRCEVSTITWPLIERLAVDHGEFAELVDVCIGPDTNADQ